MHTLDYIVILDVSYFPKGIFLGVIFPNVQFTNRQLHTSYLAASFGPLSGCSCSAWPPSPFIATTLGPHCSLLCLMAPHPDIINDALKKLKRKKKVLDQTKSQQIG